MRKPLLKLAVLFLFEIYISGCGFTNDNSIRDFIPGVYAREIEGEFSKGSDTLTIDLFQGGPMSLPITSVTAELKMGS